MAMEGGRRKLRLVGGREAVAPFAQRVPAPGYCIGVADVASEGGALSWSVELTAALCAREPMQFVACAFGEVPELGRAIRDQLAAAGARVLTCAVGADEQGFAPVFAQLEGESDRLWVCVGEPAVALLEPQLAVLVGTDRGSQHWPPSLRPHASSVALCLSAPRRALAVALAGALMGG